jgi:hypothetical protein
MSHPRESGAYLGGIGTMLGETRACTKCGGIHESHPFGFQHHGGRECPTLTAEDFALVSVQDGRVEIESPHTSEGPSEPLRTPLPVALGGLPIPPRDHEGRQPRGLEVPWLPPPDLSGVV